MLTAGELQAVSDALDALRREVERTEEAAKDARNWLAWTPLVGGLLSDETTIRARDRAELLRDDLERFTRRRDELVEAQGYDHEAVAALVEGARKLAGVDHAAMTAAEVRGASPVAIAGDAASEVAGDVARGVSSGAQAAALIGTPLIVLVVLVVLVVRFGRRA